MSNDNSNLQLHMSMPRQPIKAPVTQNAPSKDWSKSHLAVRRWPFIYIVFLWSLGHLEVTHYIHHRLPRVTYSHYFVGDPLYTSSTWGHLVICRWPIIYIIVYIGSLGYMFVTLNIRHCLSRVTCSICRSPFIYIIVHLGSLGHW